ncbi:MAG: glycerate kinase [Phycisphaerae bacterium]
MKIVIAPDSFKESLSAPEVAKALAEGVLTVLPDAEVDLCPLADGGEGTVAALVAATGGAFQATDVYGPLGNPMRARFGMLGGDEDPGLPGQLGLLAAETRSEGESDSAGDVAVIEMAAASGLALVKPDLRDPLRTTTFGTGQLILAAIEAGAREIILGLGGSATCDGGAGAAQALGVTFLDADGELLVCGLAGGGLKDIARIDTSDLDPRLEGVRIRVACDVRNPLTGLEGAAAVYGPQKGATPEGVKQLEEGLKHYAGIIREQLGVEIETLPGAGAAGGLGAGLVAFAGARLEGGLDIISEAVHLPRRLHGADLVLTGEGLLDASSRFGKATVGVAKLAAGQNIRTVCIPGQATDDAPAELFHEIRPLVNEETPVEHAMADPAELLKARAAAVTSSL